MVIGKVIRTTEKMFNSLPVLQYSHLSALLLLARLGHLAIDVQYDTFSLDHSHYFSRMVMKLFEYYLLKLMSSRLFITVLHTQYTLMRYPCKGKRGKTCTWLSAGFHSFFPPFSFPLLSSSRHGKLIKRMRENESAGGESGWCNLLLASARSSRVI